MNIVEAKKGFRTFLILALGGVSIFATVRAAKFGWREILRAEPTSIPQNIEVSNIFETSATVSWTTEKETLEFISYGETSELGQTAKTERKAKTHKLTLKNLSPYTTYYYKVGSGSKVYDNNGSPYTFTTAPVAQNPPSPLEAFGKILGMDGEPAKEALVFFQVKDQDGKGSKGISSLLSALTDASGNYALDLGNARISDLTSYFEFSGDDILEINSLDGEGARARVTVSVSETQPVPEFALSPTGTVINLTKPTPSPKPPLEEEAFGPLAGGECSILDYSKFVAAYGKENPEFDFNKNGVVDMEDYSTFVEKYKKCAP